MADYNQAGGDDQTSDLPPAQQPKYFYRLRNMEEQHHFQQSEKGILCPICSKVLRNIRMHFNKSKECAEKLDMDHFSTMYEILNASVRKGYLRSKKQIEREKKRKEDEECHRKIQANEKQAQREKKKEKDEKDYLRKNADEMKAQRSKQRDEDEENYLRKNADEIKAQRCKQREEDVEAYLRKNADEMKAQRHKQREEDEKNYLRKIADEKQAQRRKKEAQIDERQRRYNFFRAVIFGPIFICSCCHRRLYENGVTMITEQFIPPE